MAGGYLGKILTVNLTNREMKVEELSPDICRKFIGGYGIGARLLYTRMQKGVDPLGPDNILGFFTGPLTGTPAITGSRFTVVGKSPLTGGWGDANSGGSWGPHLKFAGYDAILFYGMAEKPVYLNIEDGKFELKDAAHLWGKGTSETQEIIKRELNTEKEVVSIGPAGEQQSLLAAIISGNGRAAGRSGLGAVMGAKKIKAIAVSGKVEIPFANLDEANRLRREFISFMQVQQPGKLSYLEQRRKYGTTGNTETSLKIGDAPVKNWGGIIDIDLKDYSGLTGEAAIANLAKHDACWHCPIACGGVMKEGIEYPYPAGTRRAEYETQIAFGSNCLNNNAESIHMCEHLCNDYGIDVISTGGAIAFAIECYENGIVTKADTDGIEMTWGNHQSIVAMTEKTAKREGFGATLADGVKLAAERIGRGAEAFAIHIGGQELGYHDPKVPTSNSAAARYQMDATPGRHTQGFGPEAFLSHILNATGLCLLGGWGAVPNGPGYVLGFLNSVTGFGYSFEELLKIGESIATIRHAFNLRDGINPLHHKVHPRIIGEPPFKAGPLAGITADINAQVYWNLGALDWNRKTTIPSKKKLLGLGLDDIAKEL